MLIRERPSFVYKCYSRTNFLTLVFYRFFPPPFSSVFSPFSPPFLSFYPFFQFNLFSQVHSPEVGIDRNSSEKHPNRVCFLKKEPFTGSYVVSSSFCLPPFSLFLSIFLTFFSHFSLLSFYDSLFWTWVLSYAYLFLYNFLLPGIKKEPSECSWKSCVQLTI